MVRKLSKKVVNKNKGEYNGPDLIDTNARALIAFGLMMICFLLVYAIFIK